MEPEHLIMLGLAAYCCTTACCYALVALTKSSNTEYVRMTKAEATRERVLNYNFKDDRCYQKGDKVILLEYDDTKAAECFRLTGRSIDAEIGSVTAFEQQNGYVVFSLLNIKNKE